MSDVFNIVVDNARKHAKELAAILGDITTSILTIVFYVMSNGLQPATLGFMVMVGVKPFLFTYISIIFKGKTDKIKAEANDAISDNVRLKDRILYEREIAEYKIILAAKDGKVPEVVIANKDWNDANEKLTP